MKTRQNVIKMKIDEAVKLPVDKTIVLQADTDEHKRGLPMFRERFSPVEHWNCKYCKFLDFCNPPF